MKTPAKKHFNSREECIEFLGTLSMNNIVQWLADYLLFEQPDKMTISEEQFKAFFKIRGVNAEGEKENRGRKKKD